MSKFIQSAFGLQWLVYGAVSLMVLLSSVLLEHYQPGLYRPFFGRLNPILVVTLIIFLGAALFYYLISRDYFFIFRPGNGRGLLLAVAFGAVFFLVIFVIDWLVVLPQDINRPFPASLPFYFSIGFVVEILFHVLPLTLLLALLTSIFPRTPWQSFVWPLIGLVALLEPLFQTAFGFSRPYPWWVMLLIACNIYLINLAQLYLFQRYDFLSMYTLRLVYYTLWHILWGILRLRILF